MDEVFSSRPDLPDQPLSDPEVEYFTDTAVLRLEVTGRLLGCYYKFHKPLPAGTSTQKVELNALSKHFNWQQEFK